MRTSSTQNKPNCLSYWLSLSLSFCTFEVLQPISLSLSHSLSRSLSLLVCVQSTCCNGKYYANWFHKWLVMELRLPVDNCSQGCVWKSLREVCSAGSQAQRTSQNLSVLTKAFRCCLAYSCYTCIHFAFQLIRLLTQFTAKATTKFAWGRWLISINWLVVGLRVDFTLIRNCSGENWLPDIIFIYRQIHICVKYVTLLLVNNQLIDVLIKI